MYDKHVFGENECQYTYGHYMYAFIVVNSVTYSPVVVEASIFVEKHVFEQTTNSAISIVDEVSKHLSIDIIIVQNTCMIQTNVNIMSEKRGVA